MPEVEVFALSESALANVIDAIRADQWDLMKPEWFATGGQGKATLREIVNYHTYDSAWVPDVLAGRAMAEVAVAHEALKTAARCNYREYSDAAVAAARACTDLDRAVHLSYGDFPAREYLKHITSFRGFRVYDIARWIGADTKMPPALVEAMWDELAPEMDTWRAMGVYGPEVPVPADAPLQDRLLGRSGRDPDADTGRAG